MCWWSSPLGSWRSLYTPQIEKHSVDFQWMVVHGAMATNKDLAYMVYINELEVTVYFVKLMKPLLKVKGLLSSPLMNS